MELYEQINQFIPFNEQEEKDKAVMLQALTTQKLMFKRDNLLAHFAASAWVVNHERTKVLLAYHNIYDSWAWLGGHADGESDLLKVALKEVEEESSLTNINPVTSNIFSLEVLPVEGHQKHGKYVNAHLHLNITYLIEADEQEVLHIKADENSDIAWFRLEDVLPAVSEAWMKEKIYSKLLQKLKLVN